jgi:hypothetical protein
MRYPQFLFTLFYGLLSAGLIPRHAQALAGVPDSAI